MTDEKEDEDKKKVEPDDETKEIPLDDMLNFFEADNLDHPGPLEFDEAFLDEIEKQAADEELFSLDDIDDIEFSYEDGEDDSEFLFKEPEQYDEIVKEPLPKLSDYTMAETVDDHLGDGLINPILIDSANRQLFNWVDIAVRCAIITKLKDTPGIDISPVEIYTGTVINRKDLARNLYVQEFLKLKSDIFSSVIGNRTGEFTLNPINYLAFYEMTIRKIFEYLKYIDYNKMFNTEET